MLFDLININIILLVKYFRHNVDFFKPPALFIIFRIELKYFSDALTKMESKLLSSTMHQ